MTQEFGNGQDANTKRIVRLVHKGTKVLEITSQQMGCLTGKRRLKDRLVLLYKPFREGKACHVFNKLDVLLKCIQSIHGLRGFSLQVAACFLYRVGA